MLLIFSINFFTYPILVMLLRMLVIIILVLQNSSSRVGTNEYWGLRMVSSHLIS